MATLKTYIKVETLTIPTSIVLIGCHGNIALEWENTTTLLLYEFEHTMLFLTDSC